MPYASSVEHSVLRIDGSPDAERKTRQPLALSLSGELVAATLPNLEPLIEGARAAGRMVELDLDGVVRADRAAAEYLARVCGTSVRLLHCPLSLRALLRMPGHCAGYRRETP